MTATFPAHRVAVGTDESGGRGCARPGEELREDPQRRPGPVAALLLWPACLSHAGTHLRGALLTQHPATSTAACVGRSVPSGVTQYDPQRGCRTGGPSVVAEGVSIWGPPVHSVTLLCPRATGPVSWGSVLPASQSPPGVEESGGPALVAHTWGRAELQRLMWSSAWLGPAGCELLLQHL